MAKVSEVKVEGSGRNLGEFRVEKFNLFEAEDMERYAELRTKANDASSGVKLEMVREYSRKTTTCEGTGEEQITTHTEEVFLVVHYWTKKPTRDKGDSDDEISEARRDLSIERPAQDG